ncbi:MAG TPA: ATP-binding protein [Candidatus Methylomirabilis sp.]|nr:ATP-binding protein [Candidatus Methylomirabilis sp.]
MSHSLDLDEVLRKSVTALTQITGHEIAGLHLTSPDGQTLLLRSERGFSDRLREMHQVLSLGQGLIGRVAQNGRVRRLDQITRAADWSPVARAVAAADGIRGFVCVPILARQRILGALSVGRTAPKPFSDEEVALLEAAADQIGLAVDNASLYSETRQQVETLRRAQTEVINAERHAAALALAEGVAHKINNPLMIILGQAHRMIQSNDSGEILKGLRIIDEATRRAATIIKELMLFVERTPLRPTRCLVADHVRHALALYATRLEARHVDVHVEIQEAPAIWADGGQLQEVFSHLIENAEQAMVAAHGRGQLTVRVGPSSRGVRIEIADDGPGIPSEDLRRIFDPFFTTKPPDEGRGLGLSVAQRVVADHGGQLRAENRPGGGAVFVIELPIGALAADEIGGPLAHA